MSSINVKTRGDSSPNGKPRVYFCCHPEDFTRYFEKISGELLALQNCAVWYRVSDEPGDDERLQLDLGQMQLFVMPVTTKLLAAENRGLREFRFAVQAHIPVLPLMQESGLEVWFNKVCGDLQFLDENARDDTSLSYTEKLKKYLDSVLVGDELAGQVRAAFDAYIFLSYRKKDRRYAQELMRLIHGNDFCRDVAIWYDEFLTPGENFNDSIAAALQKSRLFALVVTPNLVNEQNYVMTTEYPAARKERKPILPVELVATDQKALEEQYESFPGCVDGKDKPALSDALLRALQDLARRENHNDPKHDFFIGLAYLGGVDVEVDHERAVRLITAAADAGLPEAAGKLASMYTAGEGVVRNYETAVSWREKLVAIRKARYEASKSDDDLDDLLKALAALGAAQRGLEHLPEAMAAFRQMESLAVQAPQADRFRQQLADSYAEMGGLLADQGKIAEASEYYQKNLDISQQLIREKDTPRRQRELANICEQWGLLWENAGGYAEAGEWYSISLGLYEALAKRSASLMVRHDLVVIYRSLGRVRESENKRAEAAEFYRKEYEISRQLLAEADGAAARRNMADSCGALGLFYFKEGKLTDATELFRQALDISSRLVEETGALTDSYNLAVGSIRMGYALEAAGKLSEAEACYSKSVEIAGKLADATNTKKEQRVLAIGYAKSGDIRKAEGKLDEAAEFYLKGIEMLQKTAGESGLADDWSNMAVGWERVGDIRMEQGRLAEAAELFARELSISEKLAEKTRAGKHWRLLAVGYEKSGDVRKAQGRLAEAAEFYAKELEISETLASESGEEPDALRALAVGYEKSGDLRKAQGKTAGAAEFYTKELKIFQRLAEEVGTPESRDDLASACFRLASVREGAADRELLEKARDLWASLCAQSPENVSYRRQLDEAEGILRKL